MNRSIPSAIATALLAIAAVGGAAAANASTDLYFRSGAPARVVHVSPQPAYVAQSQYGDDWGHGHERGWRQACGAHAWDPQLRYMPGQAVLRHGALYVATGLSASVWNVNSPPEWTPNYWVPARCR
jgi:hypothetical protein